ncbi:hypothetical protein CGMCC3_g7083 [Colletotrichum fructicola]|nr:uncharacterized protein CGMCC3_g7083 [Colletotrichum fructicola]KAE9576781.1 hypothetical protein CGMCC3_g7083 [Colletotrichum fructicola]
MRCDGPVSSDKPDKLSLQECQGRQGKASKPQALGTTLCKKNVRALFVVRPAIRSVVESVILDIPEALTAKLEFLCLTRRTETAPPSLPSVPRL